MIEARNPTGARPAGQVWLTGLTGSMGGFLAAEGLRRGWSVTALVRDSVGISARDRAAAALKLAGVPAGAFTDRFDVHVGDLETAGLPSSIAPAPASVPQVVLHAAGCVEFDERPDRRLWRTNVDATANALASARKWGAAFVHVSTAYVAGDFTGRAAEDDSPPNCPCRNDYERAKRAAEELVHRHAERTGLPVVVLRPSIVLGDSVLGRIGRFHTVYDVMAGLDRIARRLGRVHVRVDDIDGQVRKNIVPVDWLAEAAWDLIESGARGTFHLTHDQPISLDELRDILVDLSGVEGMEWVPPSAFEAEAPTPAERIFHSALAAYRSYLSPEPTFDRARLEAHLGPGAKVPAMDGAYFRRLLNYARSVRWGRSTEPTRAHAQAADVARYFQEFLVEKLDQQLLPDLRNLTAEFAIRITDTDLPTWRLSVRQGALAGVVPSEEPGQCLFLVDADTFAQVVSGELPAPQAFFQRRVEIEGDLEVGLKLATVLRSFFVQYPYYGRNGRG